MLRVVIAHQTFSLGVVWVEPLCDRRNTDLSNAMLRLPVGTWTLWAELHAAFVSCFEGFYMNQHDVQVDPLRDPV